MDAIILARTQFAFTVSFHFLPAFSIGLASYLAVLEALWLKTGKGVYANLAVWIADGGEILLDGPVCLGAIGNPAPNLPLHTNNIGHIDAVGRLYIDGRKTRPRSTATQSSRPKPTRKGTVHEKSPRKPSCRANRMASSRCPRCQ